MENKSVSECRKILKEYAFPIIGIAVVLIILFLLFSGYISQ